MNADASGFDPALLSSEIRSFVIDSREAGAGDVFIALSQPEYRENGFNGEFEDSTVYAAPAFANGALAGVVRPDRFAEHRGSLEPFRNRLAFVDDSIAALQRLAAGVYRKWGRPVVAITGSAGKTTARELTAHVLASSGRKVLSSRKNYNNGIGHPLTVLRLDSEPDFDLAVLEMGMSTPLHEIERLCRITPPDVAVELNVLPVHIEHLGTIDRIAAAKAELVEGMKPGGTAVLNADDERVLAMRGKSKGRTITFGLAEGADIRALNPESPTFGEIRFRLKMPGSEAPVVLPLAGRHNVSNALAAAAAGHCFGMDAEEIANALGKVEPPAQRGEILRFREGFTVVNDSYNSNPAALLSMVRSIAGGARPDGRTIVVAGEMLELGPEQEEIHRQTGREIAAQAVDLLVGVRGLAAELVAGAREGGLAGTEFFADADEAGRFLSNEVRGGDLVLIKGSRGVRTEKVVQILSEDHLPA